MAKRKALHVINLHCLDWGQNVTNHWSSFDSSNNQDSLVLTVVRNNAPQFRQHSLSTFLSRPRGRTTLKGQSQVPKRGTESASFIYNQLRKHNPEGTKSRNVMFRGKTRMKTPRHCPFPTGFLLCSSEEVTQHWSLNSCCNLVRQRNLNVTSRAELKNQVL